MLAETPLTTKTADWSFNPYYVAEPRAIKELVVRSPQEAAEQIGRLRRSFHRCFRSHITNPDLKVRSQLFKSNYRTTVGAIRDFINTDIDNSDLGNNRLAVTRHLGSLLSSVYATVDGIDGYNEYLNDPVLAFCESSLSYWQKVMSGGPKITYFKPAEAVKTVSGLFKALSSNQEEAKFNFQPPPDSQIIKGDPDAFTVGLFHSVYYVYQQILANNGKIEITTSFKEKKTKKGKKFYIFEIYADSINLPSHKDPYFGYADNVSTLPLAIKILNGMQASFATGYKDCQEKKKRTVLRILMEE